MSVASASVPPTSFGQALRWWRTERRFSQLQLASDAEVSTRHLSYLENGKARPSREMVVHLATTLDLSLRDSNHLLTSAGFAPVYTETRFDAPEMGEVRAVLTTLLDAHMPNPAAVVDRRGDLVDANAAALLLMAELIDASSSALQPAPNLNRLSLHPEGLRSRMTNWEPLATVLIQRLEREVQHRPADGDLRELFDEMMGFPDVERLRRTPHLPAGSDLVTPLDVTTFGGDRLRLITTIATLGAAFDVTLDELRLETFFPTDEASRRVLAAWSVDRVE